MRPPVVKRQTLPKSGCCHFFSAVLQAKRRPPLATCAVCLAVCWGTNVTAPHTSCGASAIGRAGTERMARVRGALETALSPPLVLRTRGAAPLWAPVRRRGGGGAAHGHPQGRSPEGQEREPASKPRRRGRATCRWAQARSSTPERPQGSARRPGGAQRGPGRLQARLRPSRRSGARGRERPRPAVATGERPPGPGEAPRPSRPYPSRVVARSGPAIFGPQAGGGGPGAPRRTRPM